ncbi:MAG: hypothetical protein ACRD0H_25880 [Actinomycetes bacterium]
MRPVRCSWPVAWGLGVSGLGALASALALGDRLGPDSPVPSEVMALAVLLLLGAVGGVVVAARPARSVDTAVANPMRDQAYEAGWREGRALSRGLVGNVLPTARQCWGVVLRWGESAYLEVSVLYSRYGAYEVSARPRSGARYYYGGGGQAGGALLAVAATSLVCEVVESRRDREAITPRWRMQEHTRAILTNKRVLVYATRPHGRGRWVSMDIDAITEFYPDLVGGVVEVRFGGSARPMRLEGPSVPAIAAWLCWALHGPAGLRNHPALHALR